MRIGLGLRAIPGIKRRWDRNMEVNQDRVGIKKGNFLNWRVAATAPINAGHPSNKGEREREMTFQQD